jgi:hypothetical protein
MIYLLLPSSVPRIAEVRTNSESPLLFISQYVEDHQYLDTTIQSNVVMLIHVELSVHHNQ